MNNLIKKINKNEYIFASGVKIFLVLIGFVESVIVARYLGAELNGDVSYVKSVTAIGTIIFSCGIHQAYPYLKRQEDDSFKDRFFSATSLLVIFYWVMVLVLNLIIKDMLMKLVIWIVPLQVMTKLVSYVVLIEYPILRNKTELFINVINVVVIICLYISMEPNLLIGMITLILKDVIMLFYYSFKLKIHISYDKKTIGFCVKLASLGIIPMISLLLTNLNYKLDIIMLKSFEERRQIGIYSVGVSLAEKCWLITDTLRDIMTSKLAKGKGIEEVSKVMRVSMTVTLGLMVGMAICGKPFVDCFYGREYQGAYEIIILIMLGAFGMNYTKIVSAYNIVYGRQKVNLIIMFTGVIINAGVNYVLIPRFGIRGAAGASIISYSSMGILFLSYYMKQFHVKCRDVFLIRMEDIDKFRGVK